MTLGENAANSAVAALESVEAVDAAALKLAGAVSNAIPVGPTRDALSGTWIGHALHPALTDVVIGSFLSATLLDLLGGDDSGRASERLIEIGLVASAPTIASGLSDWASTRLRRPPQPPGRASARRREPDRVRAVCGVARREAPGRPGPGQAGRPRGQRGALGRCLPRRSPLVHARSRCQRDGVRRGAPRLDDGRGGRARGWPADQRDGGRHARSAAQAQRSPACAPRSLLASRLPAQQRRGRGRVHHLPLPRLTLRPSRRLDRAWPGDGAATGIRDPRRRERDRGEAARARLTR